MRVQVDNLLACNRLGYSQRDIALGHCFHLWLLRCCSAGDRFYVIAAAAERPHLHATLLVAQKTSLLSFYRKEPVYILCCYVYKKPTPKKRELLD